MPLNTKIKEITLKLTLHHILRNAHKSPLRTCRHIIALGQDLSDDCFTLDTLSTFQNELKTLLHHADEEQIKNWLVLKFHLK